MQRLPVSPLPIGIVAFVMSRPATVHPTDQMDSSAPEQSGLSLLAKRARPSELGERPVQYPAAVSTTPTNPWPATKRRTLSTMWEASSGIPISGVLAMWGVMRIRSSLQNG